MQRLGGLLLMLAGLSLGAYTFLPAVNDGEAALREVTRISAAPDRIGGQTPSASSSSTAPSAAPAAPSEVIRVAELSAPSSTWSAIVSSEPGQSNRITSSKPGDEEARIQLARDLQGELKRVGCYSGDITGHWTPATRRAMSAFMERVNASLPIDEPDYILLTLVQGHAAQACGAGCPAGQAAGDEGRCVPQAILAARAAKKAKSVAELKIAEDEQQRLEVIRAAEEARKAEIARIAEENRKREDARIADAKRKADDRRVAEAARKAAQARVAEATNKTAEPARTPEAERNSETQTQFVAEASKERLPWLADDLTVPAPRRVERPDGMMSVGGPKIARAEVPEMPISAGPVPANRAMPEVPATETDAAVDASQKPTAAPVIVPPAPERAWAPVQGAPGTKSGVAARPGLPGSKSGRAIDRAKRGWAAAAIERVPLTGKPRRKATAAAVPKVFKPAKPKFFYYAQGSKPRRSLARPGSPAYNMQAAMGGVF